VEVESCLAGAFISRRRGTGVVCQWMLTAGWRPHGADVGAAASAIVESRRTPTGALLTTPYLFHVRHDGAGDPGRLPGPHRTCHRVSPP